MTTTFCVSESIVSTTPASDGPEHPPIYCSCQSEYCDCGSKLGVTEAAARKVYQHLGFSQGRETLRSEGHRECALHIWGTHNLSTDDVLSWLADYHPIQIEWINDASCNVVFSDPNTVLRVIVDFAEPFDRRVALAAAAALATLLEQDRDRMEEDGEEDSPGARAQSVTDESESGPTGSASLHLSSEALNSIEQFSQYLPPTGRWYKALSVPAKTISLFLRFAHKSDVKLPGSERRSLYYRRYGNPNYGGMTGILSRSYRRRIRSTRPNHSATDSDDDAGTGTGADDDIHHNLRVFPRGFAEAVALAYDDPDAIPMPEKPGVMVSKPVFGLASSTKPIGPAPRRELIVYDNLYGTDQSFARAGTRREAIGFPTPKSPKQPRKWLRKDRGPAPNRWLLDDEDEDAFSPPPLDNINVIDLREPWSTVPPNQPFVFGHSAQSNRRVRHRSPDAVTTITLLPDPQSPTERRGASPTEDTAAGQTRRLLASMTMVADMEEQRTKKRSLASRLGSHKNSASHGATRMNSRNVWQRLG